MIVNGLIDKQNQGYIDLVKYAKEFMVWIDPLKPVEPMIDRAIYTFMEITHVDTIEAVHRNAIARLAEYLYERLGNTGVKSFGAGDFSTSYSTDIPHDILRSILSFRRLP